MATTTANAAGFERVQFAVAESGIPAAYSGMSTDTVLGMTRLFAAQAAEVSVPAPEAVPIEADDGVDAQFQFDVTELENFEMTLGRSNHAFVNAIQGTAAIDMQSELSALLRNPKGRAFTNLAFLLTRRAQLRDGATGGGYEHVLLQNATATYLGSAFETQGAGAYGYQIVANLVNQTFYGNPLGADSNEVGGKNNGTGIEFYTQHPITIDVYKSDGAATTFTPTQTPRTGGLILAWDAGDLALATSPTTIALTLSNGDFSFTAPDSGDFIVVLYEVAE